MPEHASYYEARPLWVKKEKKKKEFVSIQMLLIFKFVLA